MRQQYVDDSDLTEITILPDGRVYAFGLSERVAAMLATLQSASTAVAAGEQQEIEVGREGQSAKRKVTLVGDAREQR